MRPTDGPQPLALLGTGLLGRPIAERLLAAGRPLTVWNRTASRSLPLAERGATVAQGPDEAVAAAGAVIAVLADAPALHEVLLAPPVLPALSGRTVIQMGTIAPDESRRLAAAVERAGGSYLEAPVLGSIPEAREGRLLVMAGGDVELLDRWRPVLELLGTVRHIGTAGRAAALKLAMNQLIASLTTAYATSLAFVRREGVPLAAFVELVRASALYAPTFDKKLERMLTGSFTDPNFPLRHLRKDVRLTLGAARDDGLFVAPLEGIAELLERAEADGLGDEDYSALAAAVERGPVG